MAFIKVKKVETGDILKTTIEHSSLSGIMEIGTFVKVVGESERGYDIEDFEGNRIIECGWTI